MNNSYYSFYKELRKMPLMKLQGSWLVSRYKDAKYILENQELFSSNRNEVLFSKVTMDNPKAVFVKKVFDQWINHTDTPTKNLKSELIQNVFSYTKLKMGRYLESNTAFFLDENKDLSHFDFKTQFAIPLLAGLVMDMLNVELIDKKKQYKLVAKHTMNIAVLISKLHFNDADIESLATSLLYVIQLGNSFDGTKEVFEMDAFEKEYPVTLLQKTVIFSALMHDTSNMMCNCYYNLSKYKDKFELKDLKKAIKESNRLESPVQTLSRVAQKEVIIGRQKITKGDSISVFIGSANRDETIKGLEDGDEFRMHRRVQLLTFGRGLHACIGQHLAEEVVSIVFSKLLVNKNIQIDTVEWEEDSRNYRSMKTCMVTTKILECH